MASKSLVSTLLLGGLLAATPAAAQTLTYAVTDVTTGSAGTACIATAISDAGVLAGSCAPRGSSAANAASWKDGARKDLGKLSGGTFAYGTAVNRKGIVVGDGDTGDFQPRPFVTLNGRLVNVDPQGGANMRTVGILDNGVIFANYAKGLSGNTSSWTPVYYVEEARKPGRYRRYELPRVAGGDSNVNGAYITASNHVGQVVGWVQNSLFGQRGAFWNNDSKHTVVVLEPLAGSTQSIAYGVNDIGQAVGASWIPFVGDRAILWSNDAAHTPVDLGVLPGDTSSTAVGINVAGQVVGMSYAADRTARAFLYENGTMQDLSTLVDPALGAVTVYYVFGINNNGQITALARINGQFASVILTPTLQ
jgi:probable HAF family extracellular repeat protein